MVSSEFSFLSIDTLTEDLTLVHPKIPGLLLFHSTSSLQSYNFAVMSPPSRDLPSYEYVGVHATSDTSAVTIPDPLTCTGVLSRRSKAGPFIGGVAAATSSDLFKSEVSPPVLYDPIVLLNANCISIRVHGSLKQRNGTVSDAARLFTKHVNSLEIMAMVTTVIQSCRPLERGE